jgi:hypothetical protein
MTTGTKTIVMATAIFVVTRLLAVAVLNVGDGVQHYLRYSDRIREDGLADVYRSATDTVEYPQLSLVFMAGAGRLADALPDGADALVKYHSTPARSVADARYQIAVMLMLFTLDWGLFLLVGWQAWQNGQRDLGDRLLLYAVAGAILAPILYDRLDLPVGAFALLAAMALRAGWFRTAYLLLTFGTAFKLVPALLLPVAIFAAALTRTPSGASTASLARSFAIESITAIAIFAMWPFLATAFGGGDRAFGYLTYHSARGLEIESIYAWPVLLAAPETALIDDYHSHTLKGVLADAVARHSAAIAFIGLFVAYGLIAWVWYRDWRRSSGDTPLKFADRFITASVFLWIVFILTGKVSSPQYALWLLPLVPLLPGRRPVGMAFLAMVLIFSVIYPGRYHDVTGGAIQADPLVFAGPTKFGYLLLILRSIAVAALTWLAARRIVSNPDSPAAEESATG